MRAEDHRLAALRQRADEVLDLAASDRVESRGRFVEDDEVGIVDEGLREPDAALHALGELAHGARPRVAEADHLDELLRALLPVTGVEREEVAEEIERLARAEIAVEVALLGQVADARLGLHVARRFAEDGDLALGRVEQAEQHLDGRGFAGTVRPEQPEHLAAAHLEVDVVDRARLGPSPEILEDLGQADGTDDDLVGRRGPGSGWGNGECGHGKVG